jgi:hypothetical protein
MIHSKHNGVKFILVIVLVIFMKAYLFSWVFANGSGNAYEPPPDPGSESRLTGTVTMEADIARGAGYFLEAYAHTLLFMNQLELSNFQGLDYRQLRFLLDTALKRMKQANAAYIHLHRTAEYTPYNPVVIDGLKNFNYEALCISLGLNREIFAGVQAYLGSGSVTEMYGKLISDMEAIIKLITKVKENIDNGVFPNTSRVRQLSQAFSKSLLFGQYVADVFENLANQY